jgi:PadR family transcriptional regulator PadR
MTVVGPNIKRGSAELATLALLSVGPLHGYEIAKRIEQQTQGHLRFDLASLYPLLYRLEKRGWLKGAWQTAPSGRQRRYYRLTAAGRKKFVPLREQWRLFFRALDRLVGVTSA